MLKQVSANVYVNAWSQEQVRIRGCNHSFITTSEGMVLIDTPYLPTDAIKWRDEVTRRGEVRFIINTEHHRDHTTGNSFLPGMVVSSEETGAAFHSVIGMNMPALLQRIKERDPEGLHLMQNYKPKLPTVTFFERLNIHLGKHTFELMHLPGHTPGEVAVYIPQERVVFTGDNFTNGWHPSFVDSCPLEWVDSLKKIEAMDADVFVPGHGAIGDKKAVRAFRAFIEECIKVMRKAISQGMSKEEAAEKISFATESSPPAIHPEPEWQRNGILRLYEMLSK